MSSFNIEKLIYLSYFRFHVPIVMLRYSMLTFFIYPQQLVTKNTNRELNSEIWRANPRTFRNYFSCTFIKAQSIKKQKYTTLTSSKLSTVRKWIGLFIASQNTQWSRSYIMVLFSHINLGHNQYLFSQAFCTLWRLTEASKSSVLSTFITLKILWQ